MTDFSYGIITVSDSCHLGTAVDESGPTIKSLLQREYNALKITQSTVPDERESIEKLLIYYSDDLKLHCVLTTGGTGFAMRDVTPEATKNVIHRECPQLGLAMALESFKKTPFAALSRAVCGIRDRTLIINLPGSKKAVVECFEAIQSVLLHAIQLIRDEKEQTVATHRILQKDFKFPAPVKVVRSFTTSSETSVMSVSEFSDISDLLERSSTSMDEIILDDDILKLPSRVQQAQMMSAGDASFADETFHTDFLFGPVKDSKIEAAAAVSAMEHSASCDKPHRGSIESSFDPNAQTSSGDVVNRQFKEGAAKPAAVDEQRTTIEPKVDQKGPPHAAKPKHVCPHKTKTGGDVDDRNSPFPMLEVDVALAKVFSTVKLMSEPMEVRSPMNCPPFRASIKDGYAVKSASSEKQRIVVGNVAAGDPIVREDFAANECFKINTGGAIPTFADAIVQVEDTKLISSHPDGTENVIELLQLPKANCDVRDVGSDLSMDEVLFKTSGFLDVPEKTILASVGLTIEQKKPRIAVISTGDELVPSTGELREGQIFDSNSAMLRLLLEKHGFEVKLKTIARDDYESLKEVVKTAMKTCDVIISSGGVSMGDKDFVKPLMAELGFEISFGRVNMKPGKPMTFASNGSTSYFALPGNPVSAYVTFHIFVLPALRFMCRFPVAKCKLPVINVVLQNEEYELDARPEYARASVSYSRSKGCYYAHIHDNQISSRLGSLINADVLLHLPGATKKLPAVKRGYELQAEVINLHFISEYQD